MLEIDEANQRRGGVMSMSKLRNSTAVDTILTNGAAANALKANLGQGEPNKPPEDGAPNTATDRVSMYLRGISKTQLMKSTRSLAT